jgi:hypothetical protein
MKNTYTNLNPLSTELSEDEKAFISNIDISPKERFSVKGKVVCLTPSQLKKWAIEKWPDNKDEVGYHLATALDDDASLAWYLKLARERRSDFLKNCLITTLEANEKGLIKKTKAAYFAGVVKNRTLQQERLAEYKERTYNHTT